jgi:hypothetical protein
MFWGYNERDKLQRLYCQKVFYSQQVKGTIPIINSGSGLMVKSNVAIVGISG